MKNIEEIIKEAGIEATAEQLTAITSAVKENYRTVADYDKQKEKLTASEDKVKTLTASLDKFKDVDPEALSAEIARLKDDIAKKDADFAQQLSDRDFEDLIKGAIADAKGKNTKAIRALLDIDTLKASKNQKTTSLQRSKSSQRQKTAPCCSDLRSLMNLEQSENLTLSARWAPVVRVVILRKVSAQLWAYQKPKNNKLKER